jgi:CheY-like chemotaxis protein
VAKILVADDNSNVQKTVALALADLGVEVVAVNNGDAAIRKLADIAPDLVLADIFMPVRNGYEVCEYVKKDTRFSSVPVVLLVGAFDPLDEREAQRVGADGILKKPFVPPDPLMTMVKTLLDRAMGDRLVTVAASKPAAGMQQEKAGGIATAVQPPPRPEPVEEAPEEEFPPPVDRVSFGEGERPMAFGQLLDTPAKDSTESEPEVIEPVDDEQILTSSRDASLGEPAFWKKEEPEEDSDEETEEENSDSKEEVGISAGTAARAWKPDKEAKSGDEEDEVDEVVQPVKDPFEIVRDQDDAGHSSSVVASSASIFQDAASQAPLTVDSGKAPDLAANPIEWMASAPPQVVEETADETAEEVPEETAELNAAETEPAEDEVAAEEEDHLESEPEPVVTEFSVPVAPAFPPAPAFSLPTPPAPVMAPAPPRAVPPAQAAQLPAKTGADIPSTMKTQPSMKPLAQGAEDTARSIPKQDWADLSSSLQTKPAGPVAEKPKPAPVALSAPPSAPPAVPSAAPPAASSQLASASTAGIAEPDPALVEAVVQRILDKMRPQVVDIITKEFLRPIVQALVHREIEKH